MAPETHRSSHRLARNSMLNLAGLGLPLVVGVVAMPPVVEGLGSARFGILGLLWVVLAYLAMLDLGLGRATTKFAAEALARGDLRALRGVATMTTMVQVVVALTTGGALALLSRPLVERLLDLPPALEVEALAAFMALAAAAPIIVVTNTFRGLLEAGQRFDLVNLIRGPTSAGNFLVPLVGVWLDWSLSGIVLGLVVLRAAALIAYLTACLRLWPELRRPSLPDRASAREVLGFGGWVTISTVISPLLVYIDRFMIGALVGARAVGYYTAPHEIVSRLAILPGSLAAALFPAFSSRPTAGDASQGLLFTRAIKYLLALIAPPLLALALLGPDLLQLWLGAAFAAEGGLVLRWLALGMILNGAAYLPYTLLQASGRPDLTARFHLIELPLYLLVLWGFLARWGIVGAAAAWTLRVAIDSILLFGAVVFLRIVSAGLLVRERLPATVLSLVLLGAGGAIAVVSLDSMFARFAGVIALTILWGGWAWMRGLGRQERHGALAAVGLGRSTHTQGR